MIRNEIKNKTNLKKHQIKKNRNQKNKNQIKNKYKLEDTIEFFKLYTHTEAWEREKNGRRKKSIIVKLPLR